MKKFITIVLSLCLVSCFMTGCTNEAKEGSSNLKTVSTDGSTSMEKVIGFLSESYSKENPDVKVTYNPTGSGAGIQAVSEGRCDIGLSSRDLKDEEKDNLDSKVVAIDAIAVIVNPKNPIQDLSLEDISKIYTGEINNWKDLESVDSPIVLIGREAASGTRDGFESVTKTKDKCNYSQELTSTGDVIQTVASNPNAIGYASLSSVKENVKMVKVEGVLPTIETIQNGNYKLQRDFILVTRKGEKLKSEAQKFYDYATGETVDNLIVKAGVVPVKK